MRALLACLLCCAIATPATQGAVVEQLRVHAAPDHVRFVFDLSGPVDWNQLTLEGPDRVVLDHLYDGEFAMAEMSPEDSAQFLCGAEQGQVSGTSYHGVLFRFKKREGGALGLLWAEEDGQWKIVAYQVFEI